MKDARRNARMHGLLASAAGMIAIVAGLAPLSAHAQSAPPDRPGEPNVRAGGGPVSPKVEEILTKIENRKVKDLNARIVWAQPDALATDEESFDRKRGEIWYMAEGVSVPVFLIRFKENISNGRKERIDDQYLFDGNWYVELKNNTVTRREVRTGVPGENPYKLGEGPFPVPFGQTKADIVREFDVVLGPVGKDDPKDTDHLLLTPRPGTKMFDKYGELHFYVSRKGKEAGLPVKIKLGKLDAAAGHITAWTIVEFSDARLDRGLDPKMFEIKTPDGAEEIIERLQPAP